MKFNVGDKVIYVSDPFVASEDDRIFEGKTGVIEEVSVTESNLIFVLFDDKKLNMEFNGDECSTGFFTSQFELIK